MAAEHLITRHLDLWTTAIKRRSTAGRGSSSKVELYGIKKLRELILELAVRGLLVPQDPKDEPASELLKKIAAEKAKLVKAGVIKKEKPLPQIGDEDKLFNLASGWEAVRLGELAQVIRGVSYQKQDAQEAPFDGSVPLLRANNINVELNFHDLLHLPRAIVKAEQIVVRGDILIAMSSGSADLVGKAAQAVQDLESTFGAFCAVLRPFADVLFSFMGFFCRTPFYRDQAQATGKGIGIQNLNKSGLELLLVLLPPLAEQHRIVAKVDELMALCDQLEQQTDASLSAHQTLVETLLSALTSAAGHTQFASSWQHIAEHFDTVFTTEESIDQLKQTILQLAVMGKLVPQDPKDEPASELLKKIAVEKARLVKEGKIKTHLPVEPTGNPQVLPATWVEIVVQDFADIRLGSTPSRTEPKFWNGDIPWVSSGEVANCTIRDTSEKITQEGFNNSSTSMIPARSLLMAIIGQGKTRGQTALLEIDACTNQNVAAFVFDERFVCAEYVWTWAKSKYESHRDDGRGGAQPALNGKIVRSFRFPLAPIAEQCRIVAKVDELMALCDQLKARLSDSQATQLNLAEALTEAALAEA